MSEWKPIETYPNDGTPVIGFSQRMADMGVQRGFFIVRREEKDMPNVEHATHYFTHWMPLPEPPK